MSDNTAKTWLQAAFITMSGYMVYLIIATSLRSNMFQLPAEVINEPWFQTTLVDFYFNTAVIAAWVFFKEKSKGAATAWIISFICLGSVTTCLYVFLQFLKLKKGEHQENVFLKRA